MTTSKNSNDKRDTSTKGTNTTMSKKNATVADLAADLIAVLQNYVDVQEVAAPKAKASKAKADPEPEAEDEDDEPEDSPRAKREAELRKKSIKALRKMLIDLKYDEDQVADADKDTCIEGLLDEEFGDDDGSSDDDEDSEDEDAEDEDDSDDDTDEDDDEDDEGEDEDGYTRDELMALGIRALRNVAVDEFGIDRDDVKKADKDAVIDLILGEDDEDEDDTEDDDEDGYTEDDINEMSLKELKDLAKEWGVKVRPGTKAPALKKTLIEALDED